MFTGVLGARALPAAEVEGEVGFRVFALVAGLPEPVAAVPTRLYTGLMVCFGPRELKAADATGDRALRWAEKEEAG